MLGEIFYWVFNMSIAATICGTPVLLLRLVKRIPRRAVCFLWLIPFLRMCIPVWLTGKYGLMTLLSRFTTRSVTVHEIREDLSFTYMNHVMAADSYFPITYKDDLLENLFGAASVIWLATALALILTLGVIYFATIREMRAAKLYKENVYVSEKIQTPAVYGIIRPRIVIPHGLEQSDLSYILLHENMHIRRGDNLFRILAFTVVSIHWFNPICWLFLKLLLADIEFACDEAVLSRCGEGEKKEYARTLLSSVEKTTVFVSPFGGTSIRLRIENILSYRKLSALSVIGFSVLIISVAYIFLTNAI